MKKLQLDAELKKLILSGETKIAVGQEVKKQNLFDVSDPKKTVEFLQNMPKNIVLAENNGRIILVSALRYQRITDPSSVPPPDVTSPSKQPGEKNTMPINFTDQRKTTPVRHIKKEAFWDKTDQIVDLFPTLKQKIADTKKEIESDSCSGCAANAKKIQIIKAVVAEQKEHNIEIPEDLVQLMDPQYTMLMTTYNKKKRKTKDLGVYLEHDNNACRPGCLNCVLKHLSEALVAFDRIKQKGQFWRAIGHLAEAEIEAVRDYARFASDIRMIRLNAMASSEVPDLNGLFDTAESYMILKNKNKKKPTKPKTPPGQYSISLSELLAILPSQDEARVYIARAMILLDESLLGYPEHKFLALALLNQAILITNPDHPAVAWLMAQDRNRVIRHQDVDFMKYLREDFALLENDVIPQDSQ